MSLSSASRAKRLMSSMRLWERVYTFKLPVWRPHFKFTQSRCFVEFIWFLVLYFYITKLNIIVETKKVSTRKRTFFVPFPVGPRRRIFLALKWLKKGVFLNRSKIQLGDKLAFELMRVICSYNSNSIAIIIAQRSMVHRYRSAIIKLRHCTCSCIRGRGLFKLRPMPCPSSWIDHHA